MQDHFQNLPPSVDFKKKLKNYYQSRNTFPKLIQHNKEVLKLDTNYIAPQIKLIHSQQNDGTAIPFNSIYELVTSGKKLHVNKRILVVGKAGIGKTSLLYNNIYQWAVKSLKNENHDHNYIDQQVSLEEEFDYVFRINLHHLLTQWQFRYDHKYNLLACFIHYCLTDGESFKVEDIEIALKNKQNVLLLVDGYSKIEPIIADEESKNPVRKIFNQILEYQNIIMTSRPNVLDDELTDKFDVVVENIGFNDKAIQQYLNIFTQDEKIKLELKFFLQQNANIKSICTLPINIVMLGLIWRDPAVRIKYPKEISIDSIYNEMFNYLKKKFRERTEINCEDTIVKLLQQLAYSEFVEGKIINDKLIKRYIGNNNQIESSYISEDFGLLETTKNEALLAEYNFLESTDELSFPEREIEYFFEDGRLKNDYNQTEPPDYIRILVKGKIKHFLVKDVDKAELPKVLKDLYQIHQEQTYNFTHPTFEEYLVACYLRDGLISDKPEEVEKTAEFIAIHRNESKHFMVLKFLAGIAAHNENRSKDLVNRFWEAISCNIDGIIEAGVEDKISLFMHLLPKTRIEEKIDIRVPNLSEITNFIDEEMSNYLIEWKEEIVSSGYASSNMLKIMKEIIQDKTSSNDKIKIILDILSTITIENDKNTFLDQAIIFLASEDWLIRKKAAVVISKLMSVPLKLSNNDILPKIISALKNEIKTSRTEDVITAFSEAIGSAIDKSSFSVISELIELLKDKDSAAAYSLSVIIKAVKNSELVKLIIGQLINSNLLEMRYAIEFYPEIIKKAENIELSEQAITTLLNLLDNANNNETKYAIIRALSDIIDEKIPPMHIEKALNFIIDSFHSYDATLQEVSLRVLYTIIKSTKNIKYSRQSLDLIVGLLCNKQTYEIKIAAAKVLAKTIKILFKEFNSNFFSKKQDEIFASILNLFENQDQSQYHTKEKILYQIVKIINNPILEEKAIKKFISLLKNQNKDISEQAIKAFPILLKAVATLKSKKLAIQNLLKLIQINNYNENVILSSISILSNLLDSKIIDNNTDFYFAEAEEAANLLISILEKSNLNSDIRKEIINILSRLIKDNIRSKAQIGFYTKILSLIKNYLDSEIRLSSDNLISFLFVFNEIVYLAKTLPSAEESFQSIQKLLKIDDIYIKGIAAHILFQICTTQNVNIALEPATILLTVNNKNNIHSLAEITNTTEHLELTKAVFDKVLNVLKTQSSEFINSPIFQYSNLLIFKNDNYCRNIKIIVNSGENNVIIFTLYRIIYVIMFSDSAGKAFNDIKGLVNSNNKDIQLIALHVLSIMIKMNEAVLSDLEFFFSQSDSNEEYITHLLDLIPPNKIELIIPFLKNSNNDIKNNTIFFLLKFFSNSEEEKRFDKIRLVDIITSIFSYYEQISDEIARGNLGIKKTASQEAEKLLDLLFKIFLKQTNDLDENLIKHINKNFHKLLGKSNKMRSLFKSIGHSILKRQPNPVTLTEQEFLLRCIDHQFTSSFLSENSQIIFDGKTYRLDPAEFRNLIIGVLNNQYICNSYEEDKAQILQLKQYLDNIPLFKNLGSAIKKSAIDIEKVTSLVDFNIVLTHNNCQLSLISMAEDSSTPINLQETFILIEHRDFFGRFVAYKLSFSKGKESFTFHPNKIDTKNRKEIFGDMKYNPNRITCYATIVDITEEEGNKLLNKFDPKSINNITNTKAQFHAIVSLLKETLTKAEFDHIDSRWLWDTYISNPKVKKLDKKTALKLEGPDLRDFEIEDQSFQNRTQFNGLHAGLNNLKTQFDKFKYEDINILQDIINKEKLSRTEQDQLMIIENNDYLNSFYQALSWQLNATYIAVQTIVTGMGENKKRGTIGNIGKAIKMGGEYTPMVGMAIKLIGDVLQGVDKIQQNQMVCRYSHIIPTADSNEMVELTRIVAINLTLSLGSLKITESKSILQKLLNLAQTAIELVENTEGDINLENIEEVAQQYIKEEIVEKAAEKVEEIADEIKDIKTTSQLNSYIKRFFNKKSFTSSQEKNQKRGEGEAEIVAKFIIQHIFAGSINGNSIQAKGNLIIALVKNEYTAIKVGAEEIAKEVLSKLKETKKKELTRDWIDKYKQDKEFINGLAKCLSSSSYECLIVSCQNKNSKEGLIENLEEEFRDAVVCKKRKIHTPHNIICLNNNLTFNEDFFTPALKKLLLKTNTPTLSPQLPTELSPKKPTQTLTN
jgi:hypothetical protein